MNENHKYDDIINLPHPTPKKHPRMSMLDRAAQFSPFAALSGYNDAVKETARLTDKRIELDEYEKAELDNRLQLITESQSAAPEVSITYFVPDKKKTGGEYRTAVGVIKKVDPYERLIILQSGIKIPMNDVYGIESSLCIRRLLLR